ncbi:gnt1 [Symbiodinium pilosum]|uniref:Gnt1 protein n=1 Tax=Symbiodinium pilosum TaxID=2952 RepID=A0A812X0T3_SYMPI|nr:gnt1 [Symbiodinium pilosum]
MLLQAERPDLINVGVVWQGLEDPPFSSTELAELHQLWQVPAAEAARLESPALSALLDRNESFPHMPRGEDVKRTALVGGHIRLVDIQAKDARGCHWARYIAQLLWEGEELYLQLDSHMRFTRHWDTELRRQLALCSQKAAKPVLSNYGRPYSLGTPANWTPSPDLLTPSHICAGYFDADGILRHPSIPLRFNWTEPRKHVFWSGHFSFSSARVLQEVPFDPQLPMAHFPEEPLMAVRLFTHGWDVFAPTRGIIFHLWERDYRRTFFEMKDLYAKLYPVSLKRVNHLLCSGARGPDSEAAEAVSHAWPLPGGHVAEGSDPFGLGEKRSLEEFERLADISFAKRRIGSRAYLGDLPVQDYIFALIDPPDLALMLLLPVVGVWFFSGR